MKTKTIEEIVGGMELPEPDGNVETGRKVLFDGAPHDEVEDCYAASKLRAFALSAIRAVQEQEPAQKVIEEACEWWCDGRAVRDWNEAELAKAVVRHLGDWPGCEGCDFQCDEPCTPATVAEQLHAIDCVVAELVFDGRLFAPEDYRPPGGWVPAKRRPARNAFPPAAPGGESELEQLRQTLEIIAVGDAADARAAAKETLIATGFWRAEGSTK